MDVQLSIVKSVIQSFLENGYNLSIVYDGDTSYAHNVTGKDVNTRLSNAINNIRLSDEESILLYEQGGKNIGFISMIWNNPDDYPEFPIVDYSSKLTPIIEAVEQKYNSHIL